MPSDAPVTTGGRERSRAGEGEGGRERGGKEVERERLEEHEGQAERGEVTVHAVP
jgi:hypothetical protein